MIPPRPTFKIYSWNNSGSFSQIRILYLYSKSVESNRGLHKCVKGYWSRRTFPDSERSPTVSAEKSPRFHSGSVVLCEVSPDRGRCVSTNEKSSSVPATPGPKPFSCRRSSRVKTIHPGADWTGVSMSLSVPGRTERCGTLFGHPGNHRRGRLGWSL